MRAHGSQLRYSRRRSPGIEVQRTISRPWDPKAASHEDESVKTEPSAAWRGQCVRIHDIVPARPYQAARQAKVEVGVQGVGAGSWLACGIGASSRAELNAQSAALDELNSRVMPRLGHQPAALFEPLDKPALRSLPRWLTSMPE